MCGIERLRPGAADKLIRVLLQSLIVDYPQLESAIRTLRSEFEILG